MRKTDSRDVTVYTRRGVFETASSAVHTITIYPGEDIDDSLPVEDGVCSIYTGEFGWDPIVYTSARIKASYLATALRTNGSDGFLEMFKDVIRAETGAKEVVIKEDSNCSGYIDHQPMENGVPWIPFESPEKLRAFIFNKNSVLMTDNDNH